MFILLRRINLNVETIFIKEIELEEESRAKSKNKSTRNRQMLIKRDRSLNQKEFIVPSGNEISVVFVSHNGKPL